MKKKKKMRKQSSRSRRDLLRMWEDNGKVIVATLVLLAPGLLAAGMEWQSTGNLPLIERCMCTFGYLAVVSLLWLLVINIVLSKLNNKKENNK